MSHRLWICLLLASSPALAVPPGVDIGQEEGLIPGMPPGPAPAPDRVDPLTHEVAAGLRCPVCQGMSVNDSSSQAAVQMKGRIRELVAAGYTRQDIEDYFVGRYGEWVLLEPRRGGLNQLVWLGPILGGLLGAITVGTFLGFRREDDRGPDTVVDERSGQHAPATDPHLARLLAEVEDD